MGGLKFSWVKNGENTDGGDSGLLQACFYVTSYLFMILI